MGGRRWVAIALAAVLVVGGVGLFTLLTRSSEPGSAANEAMASDTAPGQADVAPIPNTQKPTPEVPVSPESRVPGSSGTDAGAASTGSPESPSGPGQSGSKPPSPPPQPPPSPPVRPTPIACTVSVYAGPIPGVPNIRIVVTAASNVDMLWATVSEGERSLRGAIALAGGRGEQVVDGVSQGARVTVFSDASMAEPTQSCSTDPN